MIFKIFVWIAVFVSLNDSFSYSSHRKNKISSSTVVSWAKRGKLLTEIEGESESENAPADPTKSDFSFDKSKLAAEISTPFRTLRLFVYGAFGGSALIGGLTATTQLAASIANRPDSLPLSKCLTNLGVDFSVVAFCIFCFNFETGKQRELQERKKIESEKNKIKKEAAISEQTNEARVDKLRALNVRILRDRTSDEKIPANVGTLMQEAKQNVVLVAGERVMVRDALLRAMTNTEIFTSQNVLF
mmetsp:Transcript_6082/g.9128  ORF Transcript_6082/g.9128 Transcript_6082/m.9128 type:complete len:245 (+) Transcript_6082:27-761(+)